MDTDLISKANGFVAIWNRWKDYPDFIEFCNEKQGIYSAANLLNMWVAEKIDYIQQLEDE